MARWTAPRLPRFSGFPQVMQLYGAKMERQAGRFQQNLEADQGRYDAMLRAATGKSMEEMQNMSDEEIERMGRELEKQYGQ